MSYDFFVLPGRARRGTSRRRSRLYESAPPTRGTLSAARAVARFVADLTPRAGAARGGFLSVARPTGHRRAPPTSRPRGTTRWANLRWWRACARTHGLSVLDVQLSALYDPRGALDVGLRDRGRVRSCPTSPGRSCRRCCATSSDGATTGSTLARDGQHSVQTFRRRRRRPGRSAPRGRTRPALRGPHRRRELVERAALVVGAPTTAGGGAMLDVLPHRALSRGPEAGRRRHPGDGGADPRRASRSPSTPTTHDPARRVVRRWRRPSVLGLDPARVLKTLLAVGRRPAGGRHRAGLRAARPQGRRRRGRRQEGGDGRPRRRRAGHRVRRRRDLPGRPEAARTPPCSTPPRRTSTRSTSPVAGAASTSASPPPTWSASPGRRSPRSAGPADGSRVESARTHASRGSSRRERTLPGGRVGANARFPGRVGANARWTVSSRRRLPGGQSARTQASRRVGANAGLPAS